MKQGYAGLISQTFKFIDALFIAGAGISTYYYWNDAIPPDRYFLFIAIVIFLSLNVFSWFSIYSFWLQNRLYKEWVNITLSWAVVILTITALLFLTRAGDNFSRVWVLATFIVSYVCLTCYRILIRLFLRRIRSKGLNQTRVVIIGAGSLGKRACSSMLNQAWAGLTPTAFFDDNLNLTGQKHNGIEIIGLIEDAIPFIEKHRNNDKNSIAQVWIALPLTEGKRIEQLQNDLQDTATNIYFIPDLFGFNLTSYTVDEIVGMPVMNMSATTMAGGKGLVKRLEDIVVASICLMILSPLMLITAALIKIESPGPVFFKQRRYGQDGKEFLVWKFRSMTVTEDGDNVTQATSEDSRITKIGAWLRKLSIDELPQLFNVLNGNMSLIGPRPHAVAHNEFYRKKVSGYMARHKIKPGITGWAQVNGSRGETAKLEDMERRIQYDLEYIRNWSIFLDIRIFFMTFKTLINFKDTY